MNLQKVGVKFFLEKGTDTSLASFVPVFHRWIQDNLLEGMLVDVAEYTHVHHGPGVLLVAHEANYSLDEESGKRGFLYTQKRPVEKNSQQHLATAFQRVLKGCELLEKDPALKGLKFNTGHFQIFVNDRAEAPFTSESLGALEADLNPFLNSFLGGDSFQLIPEKDPQKRVGYEVKASKSESLETLAGRLPKV